MRRILSIAALTVALGASGFASDPTKAEWPQFLGPTRNGISTETGLIDAFPASGPKVVWRRPGGVGMSGLAISRGKLITMLHRDGKQFVVALDAKTGDEAWSTPVSALYRNTMGNGPRATPTIDGDDVYAFTGEGIALALNFADGKIRWQQNLLKERGQKPAEYGMASSPLVVGENVVVTLGARDATVAAFNRKSGKLAWTAGSDPAGYSSPALLTVGGKSQIVAFTGASALGVDPANGKLLWRYGYVTDYKCNIATPLSVAGNVFIASGENHGSAMLSLEPAGETFRVTEAWTSFGPRSAMRNEWQTSLLVDGKLYGFDNSGSAGPITHLACVDAKTGKQLWRKNRFGKANGIFADGKLYIVTMKGELVIVKATPERFVELSRTKPVIKMTRQAPALAGGRLYVRDDREIVCVDVQKP